MINNWLFNRLLKELTPANVFTEKMQKRLRLLPYEAREDLAYKTHTMVVYFDQEVTDLRREEEEAALRAAPSSYDLNKLNGLNIGCGDRRINNHLSGCDAHTGSWDIDGKQKNESKNVLKCWAHDLPFKSNTIDYIVALHILQHTANPVQVILDWLDIVKPGGGIGIIVPDWRYSWDARNYNNVWSHRWNPTPNLVLKLFEENWSKYSKLEYFNTYKWKLSFDFILRKHGDFIPFSLQDGEKNTYRQTTFRCRCVLPFG